MWPFVPSEKLYRRQAIRSYGLLFLGIARNISHLECVHTFRRLSCKTEIVLIMKQARATMTWNPGREFKIDCKPRRRTHLLVRTE